MGCRGFSLVGFSTLTSCVLSSYCFVHTHISHFLRLIRNSVVAEHCFRTRYHLTSRHFHYLDRQSPIHLLLGLFSFLRMVLVLVHHNCESSQLLLLSPSSATRRGVRYLVHSKGCNLSIPMALMKMSATCRSVQTYQSASMKHKGLCQLHATYIVKVDQNQIDNLSCKSRNSHLSYIA